jgi:hypothetical protein
MQSWFDIASIITTFLSVIAAILAWVAKIRWSKEYADAKDEIIRAKEAQIEVLKSQISSLQELSPVKVKEFHKIVTQELEDYNNRLKAQVAVAESEIAIRDEKIKEMSESGDQQLLQISKLAEENGQLVIYVEMLKEKSEELQTLQEGGVISKSRYERVIGGNYDSRTYEGIEEIEDPQETLTNSINAVISSTDAITNIVDNEELEDFQSKNRELALLLLEGALALREHNDSKTNLVLAEKKKGRKRNPKNK